MDHARFARPSRTPRAPLIVSALALAALLAGCASMTATVVSPTTTPFIYYAPTATSTPTPLPPAPLTWRRVAPPGVVDGALSPVAPSDGATAYACVAPAISGATGPVEQPHIYATHDFAAHWTRMANIPADKLNNQCALHVDQFDPSIVIAVLMWRPNGDGGGPDVASSTNWVSFDGGASWRKLTDAHPFMMDLENSTATRSGVTYTIRGVLTGNAVSNGLWVSRDRMATWRSIDPPGYGAANATTFAETFWLSPATGEIIAAYGSSNGNPSNSLWETHDGGAHWTQLTTPGLMSHSTSNRPFVAGSRGPSAPPVICDTSVGVTADDPVGYFQLWCSMDDGKTWQTRPNINPVNSAENTSQETGDVFAITSDGSLLATLSNETTSTLYELGPGASQWRSLGVAPGDSFGRAASLGSVVVWSGFNANPPLLLASI